MDWVPPDGPAPCDLVVVGEAPGREEMKQGRGFVGPSGRLLWGGEYDLIGGIVGRPRDTVYVTNVCKVPMPDEDWGTLSSEEKAAYIEVLRVEIDDIQPRVVLCFGRRACQALVPGFVSIGVDQGKPRWGDGRYVVMPLWHPAAHLRGNAAVIPQLAVALAQVPELLEVGLPAKQVEMWEVCR
jgi:DNA polymerase